TSPAAEPTAEPCDSVTGALDLPVILPFVPPVAAQRNVLRSGEPRKGAPASVDQSGKTVASGGRSCPLRNLRVRICPDETFAEAAGVSAPSRLASLARRHLRDESRVPAALSLRAAGRASPPLRPRAGVDAVRVLLHDAGDCRRARRGRAGGELPRGRAPRSRARADG